MYYNDQNTSSKGHLIITRHHLILIQMVSVTIRVLEERTGKEKIAMTSWAEFIPEQSRSKMIANPIRIVTEFGQVLCSVWILIREYYLYIRYGFKGVNEYGESYENLFCKDSKQIGIAVLGDSIAAHFRLPDQWFDATQINEEVLKHFTYIFENEADWPHLSARTGR